MPGARVSGKLRPMDAEYGHMSLHESVERLQERLLQIATMMSAPKVGIVAPILVEAGPDLVRVRLGERAWALDPIDARHWLWRLASFDLCSPDAILAEAIFATDPAKPWQVWTCEIVDAQDLGVITTIRTPRFRSAHKDEKNAVRHAYDAADTDLFRGPQRLAEVRGPYHPLEASPIHTPYAKGIVDRSTSRTLNARVRGLGRVEGVFFVLPPWGYCSSTG